MSQHHHRPVVMRWWQAQLAHANTNTRMAQSEVAVTRLEADRLQQAVHFTAQDADKARIHAQEVQTTPRLWRE
jgi:hypothetical protein